MLEGVKTFLKRFVPLPIRTFLLIMDEVTIKILNKIDQSVQENQKQVGKASEQLLDQILQISNNLEQLQIQQEKQQEQLDIIVKQQQTMLENAVQQERNQKELLKQQQTMLESAVQQERNQKELLKQQQTMLESAAQQEQNQKELLENAKSIQKNLWGYILSSGGHQTYSWDAAVKKIPVLGESLSYLKFFYDQYDLLKEADVSIDVWREYVNKTWVACLGHLHSEQNPERKQFVYDALKNRVIDDLELSGYEESFYYDHDCYRELCDIINRAYDYNYFPVLSKVFYDKALEKWFHQKTGLILNLENPVTYNDKINWIKLYERDPCKTRYADKYAVREYVTNTIGSKYLIPLIGVWDNPDNIDFESLPDRFVLKANHGAAWNIIVRDKSILNIPEAVEKMKWWLGKKFSFHACLELHYDGITPRVIAEEYQENGGGELNDYKVWCFDGKAHFIQYLVERHHGLKMAFFDLDWNKLPFTYNYPQIPWNVEKPDNLKELIELAEKLAANFNHVRVDFYRLNSGEWKFGEMTFTSCGGRCKWNPPEYDRIVGELFKLHNVNETK